MKRIALSAVALTLVALFAPAPAHAQATRTWISGVGDDANPCSRTAPCKTFAGAISKTASGGEIDCLDPGGFGGVTITKPITLDCSETIGGVLISGTNGILVNTSTVPNAQVTLRGLDFDGIGGLGLAGIKVLAAGTVVVENCKIYGFGGGSTPAIDIVPGPVGGQTGAVRIDIRETTVNNNANGGILIAPTGGATVTASLTRVYMYDNVYGVRAQDGSKVTAFQSLASNNSNNGYLAVSSGGSVEINLVNSVAANNGTNGIATSGAPATIRLTEAAITDNATGINTSGGGTVTGTAPGTTLNAGNTTPGAPNGTAATLQ